ncbi:hypothetical protein [Granulicella arctica]|uniref:hypothetical protein n=1 Tax=Granulicella arctica TaxID=940613 RepID=UPI0021E0D5DC|nr:hypothetical protein [Granulicella arctica]
MLNALSFPNLEADVIQAAAIIATTLSRPMEIQKPPADNGAARSLLTLEGDSSTVRLLMLGVSVRLDKDQLKHQHPDQPIGSRQKGGGNRFIATCSAAWHEQVTLPHMADWASRLPAIKAGHKVYHGQATPVDGIHYEGSCLMANNKKYVLFHCYPEDGSDLQWGS